MYAILTILCIVAPASGRMVLDPTRAFQVLRHDGNQVEMCISNFGKFGQDETGCNQGCWWPHEDL